MSWTSHRPRELHHIKGTKDLFLICWHLIIQIVYNISGLTLSKSNIYWISFLCYTNHVGLSKIFLFFFNVMSI